MFYFLKRTRNPLKETCGCCGGKGHLDYRTWYGAFEECYMCKGTGQMWHRRHGLINCHGYDELMDEVRKGNATKCDCDACGGVGAIYDKDRKWWQFWKPLGTHCGKCCGLGHTFDSFEGIKNPTGYLKEYLVHRFGWREGEPEETADSIDDLFDRINGFWDWLGTLGDDRIALDSQYTETIGLDPKPQAAYCYVADTVSGQCVPVVFTTDFWYRAFKSEPETFQVGAGNCRCPAIDFQDTTHGGSLFLMRSQMGSTFIDSDSFASACDTLGTSLEGVKEGLRKKLDGGPQKPMQLPPKDVHAPYGFCSSGRYSFPDIGKGHIPGSWGPSPAEDE